VNPSSTSGFLSVDNSGDWINSITNSSYGIVPCFAI
jgi:hypothetical protein